MAIPTLDDNLNIIGGLGDSPNTDNNLTADELKAKFDAAALIIQKFVNEILVPAVNQNTTDVSKKLSADGDSASGPLNMDGNTISGLPEPTEDDQAVNMGWVLQKIADIVGFTGAHSDLTGRDSEDQHPISAIIGLATALAGKAPEVHSHDADAINEGTINEERLPVVPITKGGHGGTTAAQARKNLGITPANIGALPTSGGTVSGKLTLDGAIVLKAGVNYGTEAQRPAAGTKGRIYFTEVT